LKRTNKTQDILQKITNIHWGCFSKSKGIFLGLVAAEDGEVVVGKSVDTDVSMEAVWVEAAAVNDSSDDLS